MLNPDVTNFFLVLLGGFGVVWSYRHFRKQQGKYIAEFEYLAFSALWGIPVFVIYFLTLKPSQQALDAMIGIPMFTTAVLFGIGVIIGMVGAEFKNFLEKKGATNPNENRGEE